MPRILFALPGLHRVIRGAETAFEAVAQELAQLDNHKVTLIGSGPHLPNRHYGYIQIPCIPRERFERYPSLPTLRTHYEYEELSFAKNLLSIYEPARYDLTVACSWPWTHWLLRTRTTAGYRPKHIFVTENGDHMVRAQHREYSFFHCDGLICTNPEYYERNKHRFPTALVPNGVDPTAFTDEAPRDRAHYHLPAAAPVALMVSALIPSKRIPEGIRAAARIKDLHLVVAGDGQLREEVRRLGNDLMPDRFHLLQLPREAMPGLYRCADAFLHMSLDEPSANVYLEALATGLPIVTHDRAVTRWTLEDQALLVNTEDSQEVTRALNQALTESSPTNARGACSAGSPRNEARTARKALTQRRYAWRTLAKDYSAFFKQILTGADVVSRRACPARPTTAATQPGAVLIGRNEGPRLRTCLHSLIDHCHPIVYVDSGSADGSLALAQSLNVPTTTLDTTTPFTAARARNAGIEKLLSLAPATPYIQVIDGDCELRPNWLEIATAALDANPQLAAVCGRRRERHPEASLYNQLTDIEWDTPPGPTKSVGGDALFRTTALQDVRLDAPALRGLTCFSGSEEPRAAPSTPAYYNPDLIAGEEPELCVRLRAKGWQIERLPVEMTLHDAAMTRFSQWWTRTFRSGHAYAEGFALHGRTPERFRLKECRSILIWAAVLPLVILLLVWPYPLAAALLVLLYPLLALKVYWRKRHTYPANSAALYAVFVVLGKFAQFQGMARYALGRLTNHRNRLIEYKDVQSANIAPAGPKLVGPTLSAPDRADRAPALLSASSGNGHA